jgi:hypothetical protein
MFSVLTSKLFAGAAGLLLVSLGLTIFTYEAKLGVYQTQLNKADEKISGLQADATTLRGNNLALDVGLAQCNASVEQFASVAKAVATNSAAAVKAAQAKRPETAERIDKVKQTPVNTCDDVKALLKNGGL